MAGLVHSIQHRDEQLCIHIAHTSSGSLTMSVTTSESTSSQPDACSVKGSQNALENRWLFIIEESSRRNGEYCQAYGFIVQ